jgi:hypothetical protein
MIKSSENCYSHRDPKASEPYLLQAGCKLHPGALTTEGGEASFCERRVSRKLTRGKFPFVLLRKPKLGGIRKESKNAPSLYSNCVPKSGSRPGPAADIPSWTGREGLEIPSFCILWIRVVRFKPSLVAAPFGPPITQRTSSNV